MSKKKKATPNASRQRSSRRKKTSSAPVSTSLEKQVLELFRQNPEVEFSAKQLAGLTGFHGQQNVEGYRKILETLAAGGDLAKTAPAKYRYLNQPRLITGRIQVTRSGAGFLLQEGGDIFISPNALGKAFNGDTVSIRIKPQRSRDRRREGEVVEIVTRGRTTFVGIVEESLPGKYFLIPDDDTLRTDFYIPAEALGAAKAGQKVLARFLTWERRLPEVEVVSVLGEAGEHNTEMHAILMQYGFQPKFSATVEAEAAQIPEALPEDEIRNRRDFRGITTFTIDPYDAKDFDDALSFRHLPNGHYEVGIHIADVSWYVRPGTEIDKEAFTRATSVYLVDRTVPMLPEKLSNFLCSLRPKEDKFTYSAVFELDSEARIHSEWIGRTVIHSDYRFNYEEAQEVLDGTLEGPYREELTILDKLAKTLRANRMGKGSIEFESNEVKFVLDETGKPLGVIRKKIQDTNRLIEDFMLLANRKVSEHLFKIKDNPPLPSVYRIHDKPDPDKLASLQDFVLAFGHQADLRTPGDMSARLNELLRKVNGTPEQNVIENIAIRSMAKAIYSTNNIGHFGLGFPFYTHFTSPIRRYPDLMIHRLLTAYGNGEFRGNPVQMEDELRHCSERERTAAEAERASVKYKQVEFIEDKIGQQFTGLISGVIESGFFVMLDENMCEGLVPVHSLKDDYYTFDEKSYALRGRATGNVLRLGDPVTVTIAGTDLRRRTIDMTLVSYR
ncbi:MAG: ribonuclease R [Bacteroidia bacterium]|nr:ribonuclease R [Bacteroidia bacterium]